MRMFLIVALALGIGFQVYKGMNEPEPTKKSKKGKKGKKKGKKHAKRPATQEEQEAGWMEKAAEQTHGMKIALGLEEEEKPERTITCELGGSTLFMHESDCLSQGGRVR